MMRRILTAVLFFVLVHVSCAAAATITMKSGRVVEGRVIEKTDDYIRVKTKEQTWKIPLDDLDSKTAAMVDKLNVGMMGSTATLPPAEVKRRKQYHEHIKAGEAQFHTYHFKKAIAEFQKAFNVNPQSDYAYQMIANCSANLQKYDDAVSYARRALAINPKNTQVRVDLGYYYRALKQYKKSIAAFTAVIPKLSKSYTLYMAYKGLGDSYMFSKEPQRALAAYKKAESLQPKDVSLLLTISMHLSSMKKFQDALGYVQRAQALQPDNPTIMILKGGLFVYLEKWDDAKKSYLDALAVFQQNGDKEGIARCQHDLKTIDLLKSPEHVLPKKAPLKPPVLPLQWNPAKPPHIP